jgi:enamine deaminase RidA (YjgF/YER057c/UK114 family)
MSRLNVSRLNPATLPPPPGYSQVTTATGGTLVMIAGQVALDQHGNVVGPGDVAAQAEQVFRNLLAALEAAGAEPRHLVKLTTFVTDMAALPAFRAARDRVLDPAHPPASTLVEVPRLFRPEFLIEVEALAVR